MADIALISCASKKCPRRAKAENMYTSDLFVKNMKYAKNVLKSARIFILSAKYGLLPLDREIDPYNVTLKDMKREEKHEWARNVIGQLKAIPGIDIEKDRFIFLAGKIYYENLTHSLPNHEIPMKNKRIGEMLQWLNEQLEKGGSRKYE